MIHEISLLNRLLADLTIQSISSKSYANPHIVGKANPTPKTQIKKNLFLGGFIYNWGGGGGGVFINRGKRLSLPGTLRENLKQNPSIRDAFGKNKALLYCLSTHAGPEVLQLFLPTSKSIPPPSLDLFLPTGAVKLNAGHEVSVISEPPGINTNAGLQ